MRVLIFLIVLACVSCHTTKRSVSEATGFTTKEKSLIHAGSENMPMRVFKINNYTDSILLRQPSSDVVANPKDETLMLLIARMYATVRDSMSLGVGIAAPQVGVLKNVIWVQRLDKENLPFEAYLNPRILQYSDLKQECVEGCLSIPDRREKLQSRAYSVLLNYDTPQGENITEMVEDFTAVIFQHEIDHLNGILYLDHLNKEVSDARRIKTRR